MVEILNVKVPEDQKKTLERLVVEKQCPSVSEYVREALRDKMERELELSEVVVHELRRRKKEVEDGEADLIPHDQAKEEFGTD
jgi:Arc/MetJ-type ribon-helix-helix transcriptional regulator